MRTLPSRIPTALVYFANALQRRRQLVHQHAIAGADVSSPAQLWHCSSSSARCCSPRVAGGQNGIRWTRHPGNARYAQLIGRPPPEGARRTAPGPLFEVVEAEAPQDTWLDEQYRQAPERAEASYRDDSYPPRKCDNERCGREYRGPSVYCSLDCTIDDA
jgi:hypothetical protein